MSRTLQDIQREYQQAALELGAETYKLHALAVEAEKAEQASNNLKNKMVGLNKEANKLQEKSQKGIPVEVSAQEGGPQSSVGEANEPA